LLRKPERSLSGCVLVRVGCTRFVVSVAPKIDQWEKASEFVHQRNQNCSPSPFSCLIFGVKNLDFLG